MLPPCPAPRRTGAVVDPVHQRFPRQQLERAEQRLPRGRSPERRQRRFRGASERSVRLRRSQRGDGDGGETKRDNLRHRQRQTAVKRDVVIDVDDVARGEVDEDVVQVPVPQADEVAHHGRRRHRPRVTHRF